jgi:hypothetical protein
VARLKCPQRKQILPLTIREGLETLENPVTLGIDFYAEEGGRRPPYQKSTK